ncbi:hypothetical protein [Marinobacter sp.]|uniref:hypothetical protein n=1 Tax=Marinobacter sp. TaxID=50741 RepID=UPI0038516A2F
MIATSMKKGAQNISEKSAGSHQRIDQVAAAMNEVSATAHSAKRLSERLWG